MEVRRGYKQTEVGVIPEDWSLKSIKQIGDPVRGASPRPAGDPRYFNGSFIPWLTVAALTNIPQAQLVVTETSTCLTEEGSLYSRTLNKGTLIIANSGATLGVAKILGIKCCANDGVAAILNLNKNVSSRYLAHYINAKTDQLRDVVATGNGQPNLNTDLIGNLKIPLPPTLAEQRAIADALSDADALIESLEQLIAKKRAVKQGTMEELLTGRRRLPGFEGEWESVTVGDFGQVVTGGTPDTQVGIYWNGSYPWVTPTDIKSARDIIQTERMLTFEGLKAVRTLPKNTLLVTCIASIGKNSILRTKGACNQQINAVIANEKYCIEFLYYLFELNTEYLLVNTGTTTTSIISKRAFKELEFIVPALSEQTAIAAVLSDMDAEVAALEAKLAKARQVKQGMMQELLTGRTRLV